MEGMFSYNPAEEVYSPSVGQAIALSKGVQTTEGLKDLMDVVGKGVTAYKEIDDRESKLKAQNDQQLKLAEIAQSNADANTKYGMIHASMAAVEEGTGTKYTKAYADVYKLQMGQYLDTYAAKARVETQFNTVNDVVALGESAGDWDETKSVSKKVWDISKSLGNISNNTDITSRTKMTEEAYKQFSKLNSEEQGMVRDHLSSINYKNKELEQKVNDTLSNQKDQWRNLIDEATLGNRTNLVEASKWVKSEYSVLNKFRNTDGSFDSEQHRRKENQLLDVEFMIQNKRQSLQKEGEIRAKQQRLEALEVNKLQAANLEKYQQAAVYDSLKNSLVIGDITGTTQLGHVGKISKDMGKVVIDNLSNEEAIAVAGTIKKIKQNSPNAGVVLKHLFGDVSTAVKFAQTVEAATLSKKGYKEYQYAVNAKTTSYDIDEKDKELIKLKDGLKGHPDAADLITTYKMMRGIGDLGAYNKVKQIQSTYYTPTVNIGNTKHYNIYGGSSLQSTLGANYILQDWEKQGIFNKDSHEVHVLEGAVKVYDKRTGTYIINKNNVEFAYPLDAFNKASLDNNLIKRIEVDKKTQLKGVKQQVTNPNFLGL